ncbi:hypothetical protein ACFFKU_03845 [Kineococcus gynurae]|uniref:Uncharacterized protein n=1 Tax=Kineococcus gynurae TaxID=452979 RepID=A0ABV5LRS1_9ACTN
MEEIWSSFIDVVHGIGAVGCALLVIGFGLEGTPARALFYAVAATLFVLALRERRRPRPSTRPVRVVDVRTLDLRDTAVAPVRSS